VLEQFEVEPVFFCRNIFDGKAVYHFRWKYSNERMKIYSEPIFRTEVIAKEDLAKFIKTQKEA